MGVLYDPLDKVLGSASKVRLLRALAPLGRAVSGRQAARLAGLPSKTAWRAAEDLAELGIIRREESTGQHLFSVNRKSVLWPAIRKMFNAEEERVEAVFERLRLLLTLVGTSAAAHVRSAVIFGSAARGTAMPGSDLDLLVLTSNEGSVDAVRNALGEGAPTLELHFGLHISPVVLTVQRFRERCRERDPFCDEVVRDAIVVVGRHPRELIDGRKKPA